MPGDIKVLAVSYLSSSVIDCPERTGVHDFGASLLMTPTSTSFLHSEGNTTMIYLAMDVEIT